MARKFKKVEGGHGHHGGAWKVAYADFVTAMMALFMVLWLLASTDAASRKEISNYFRTGILPEGDLSMGRASQAVPAIIEQTSAPPAESQEQQALDAQAEAATAISDKLGRLAAIDADLAAVIKNVHVQVTSEGIVIDTVDEDKGLLFDSASSKLTEPLERFLRAFTPVLVALDKPIVINGHTDARPFATGSRISNWDLSYQRAAAAREILEGSGLPPRAIDGVFARGSTQLYVPDEPYSAQNRRLTFLVKIAKPDGRPRKIQLNPAK
jgi:chemotaxis protein MotB